MITASENRSVQTVPKAVLVSTIHAMRSRSTALKEPSLSCWATAISHPAPDTIASNRLAQASPFSGRRT